MCAIDQVTGKLERVEVVKGVPMPRGFRIEPSGRYLFCGHQDTDSVTTFAIDGETGRLTPTGAKASIKKPVCFRFSVI